MASTISHELNNFLGLILGGVEIAGMALKKNNTEKVAATLEKLKANVSKMERFTHGLMDYTKLNSTKQVSDLNTVIADVLSFLAGPVARANQYQDPLPRRHRDSVRLRQRGRH